MAVDLGMPTCGPSVFRGRAEDVEAIAECHRRQARGPPTGRLRNGANSLPAPCNRAAASRQTPHWDTAPFEFDPLAAFVPRHAPVMPRNSVSEGVSIVCRADGRTPQRTRAHAPGRHLCPS